MQPGGQYQVNTELVARVNEIRARTELGRQLIRNIFAPKPTDDDIARANDATAIHLIETGADLTVVDSLFGFTPLHVAVFFGHLEVVKKLIESGADLFAKAQARDGSGYTPLHVAFRMSSFSEAVELILADSRTLSVENRRGLKPFQILNEQEKVSFVATLNAERIRRSEIATAEAGT